MACSKGSATFKECVLWSWLVGQPAKQPRQQPPANNQTNPTKQPTNQHQPDQASQVRKQTYQPRILQDLTGPNNQEAFRIPHHQIFRSHLGHMSWTRDPPHPHAPDWGANLPSPFWRFHQVPRLLLLPEKKNTIRHVQNGIGVCTIFVGVNIDMIRFKRWPCQKILNCFKVAMWHGMHGCAFHKHQISEVNTRVE